MKGWPDFARVLLDHLDECPVCGCPRITFGVPCEGVCECECHDESPSGARLRLRGDRAEGGRDVKVRVVYEWLVEVEEDRRTENGVTTIWPNMPAVLSMVNDDNLVSARMEVVGRLTDD